jgi:NAD(P)-dependent dehydrogenase (short-subunit alcohol dehydrogenase family)
MQDFKGKTAVITGGASGIGLAIALRLARERMNIVLADVEAGALESAVKTIAATGVEACGIVTDVSDFDSVTSLAERAREHFGNIHVLCNNAGVGAMEDLPVWELPLNDWRWTINVNLWGVIHGIKAFVGDMVAHGEPGHVINTSSGNGGLIVLPNTPIYATSKAAVSTVTEALHYQLVQSGSSIKASVLYPGPHIVASNIFTAARNRPTELERDTPPDGPPLTLETIKELAAGAGITLESTEPEEVAENFMEGLRNDAYFILPPSKDGDARVKARMQAILDRTDPEPPQLF